MIYLNGEPINVTLFPDHTSQVWKLDLNKLHPERATILWEFSHEGEIMHIAQLKMLLDQHVDRVYLHFEFLPYGRQDKSVSNDATFGLWTFAAIINSLSFAEVFIMDPHSKMALALLNKSQAVYPNGQVWRASQVTNSNLICYPDNGALVKYVDIYKNLQLPHIYGEKVRDQATGYISNYKLVGSCLGKRVLIVDDICDGGKTFEILTRDLIHRGAVEVNLFITHGLFTKGLRPLKEAGISRIFTNKGEAVYMSDGGFGFRKIH